jgi:hypothetical protein
MAGRAGRPMAAIPGLGARSPTVAAGAIPVRYGAMSASGICPLYIVATARYGYRRMPPMLAETDVSGREIHGPRDAGM